MPEPSRDTVDQGRSQGAYLALGVVALLSLVLGVWQLRTSIRLPFLPQSTSSPSDTASNAGSVDTGQDDLAALQTKDTDSDSLSDYDELYIYNTSPYLKDTDSDSYDDKTEVTSGNDPNCPSGQTCVAPMTNTGTADNSAVNAQIPAPAAIRDLLKKNGVTDDVLAKYDDSTLVQLYREVAGETPSSANQPPVNTNTNAPTTPSLSPEQLSLIKNMSAAELRAFLIQGGADKATLDRLDDATLKVMVSQVIGQ